MFYVPHIWKSWICMRICLSFSIIITFSHHIWCVLWRGAVCGCYIHICVHCTYSSNGNMTVKDINENKNINSLNASVSICSWMFVCGIPLWYWISSISITDTCIPFEADKMLNLKGFCVSWGYCCKSIAQLCRDLARYQNAHVSECALSIPCLAPLYEC